MLTEATLKEIEKTVLGFKYWMDEPGEEIACAIERKPSTHFWNPSELLAGQFYSDKVFWITFPLLVEKEWSVKNAYSLISLSIDINTALIEWHSNTYYEEDVAPLSLLIDFSEDEEIRVKASVTSWIWFCSIGTSIIIKGILLQRGKMLRRTKKDPNRQDVFRIL